MAKKRAKSSKASKTTAATAKAPAPPPGRARAASRGAKARFDPPPPQPATRDLDHVLDQVDDLSQGINAMLQHASASAVGAQAPAKAPAAAPAPARVAPPPPASDPGDSMAGGPAIKERDDGEMMTVFDEDQPSDIRSIDRMLAQQADDLLEGEFEEVEHAAEEASAAKLEMPTSATASAAHVDSTPARSLQTGSRSDAGTQPAKSADAVFEARSPVALQAAAPQPLASPALQHTQAAGLAAAITQSLNQPAAATSASAQAVSAANAALPASAKPNAAAKPARRHLRLKVNALAIIVRPLAALNTPLRALPPSLRSAVNLFAASLVLWAPAVWFFAPHIAAERSAGVIDLDAVGRSHNESSLKAEDEPGESAHAESHGGSKSAAKSSSAHGESAGRKNAGSHGESKSAKAGSASHGSTHH